MIRQTIWKGILRTQVEFPLCNTEILRCSLLFNDGIQGIKSKHMEGELSRAGGLLGASVWPVGKPQEAVHLVHRASPSLLGCVTILSGCLGFLLSHHFTWGDGRILQVVGVTLVNTCKAKCLGQTPATRCFYYCLLMPAVTGFDLLRSLCSESLGLLPEVPQASAS